MRILLALCVVLLAAPLPALAGGSCHDADFIVGHIFEAADADQDGVLTADEYAAAELERYGVSFEDTDANDDGETSLDEYRALYDRHHPETPVAPEDTV